MRLHGDLFLENILLPTSSDQPLWPTQLVLIDPVSVAGMSAGHPLFDLAKYESYATGELPAMEAVVKPFWSGCKIHHTFSAAGLRRQRHFFADLHNDHGKPNIRALQH